MSLGTDGPESTVQKHFGHSLQTVRLLSKIRQLLLAIRRLAGEKQTP